MRGCPTQHHLTRDEEGLTAVIEFLSAFTLFLMILTAFLALAQLQLGSNDPQLDRLDRAASEGLDRLTSGEGWFVPFDGSYDYDNSTKDWHFKDADALDQGRVLPGLVVNHRLNFSKITALHNVTEEGMAYGLGLDRDMTLFLSISVSESVDTNRSGLVLFSGGTQRGTAPMSSTAYRTFPQDGEVLSIVLEVHNGGRKNNIMELTEVMIRPASNGPEWIEVNNPNHFAIALRGWSLNHTSGSTASDYLFQSGVISGRSVTLITGDGSSQVTGNATHIIDLGQVGFLGVGQFSGLNDARGQLRLRYTQLDEITPADVARVSWGGTTGLVTSVGGSLVWDGTDRFASSAWNVSTVVTPGDVEFNS